MRLKSILKQLTVINCILFAGVLLFAYLTAARLLGVDVKAPAPSVVAANSEQKKEAAPEQTAMPPMQDYAVIPEKNLFHPERIIPAEKKEAEVPRPEFVLYGTLIVDNTRIAYLTDKKAPRTTPGRGKRQVALKIGETYSGYTLKEVLPDGAVMVRGDDRIELKVVSPESRREKRGAEGGVPAMPGVQPAMPTPAMPQATVPPAMMPQTPAGQRSPQAPAPGTFRSRRPIGR